MEYLLVIAIIILGSIVRTNLRHEKLIEADKGSSHPDTLRNFEEIQQIHRDEWSKWFAAFLLQIILVVIFIGIPVVTIVIIRYVANVEVLTLAPVK